MSEHLMQGPEKRQFRRYEVPIALALEAGERKNRVGIALDVSASGVRFNTPSHFAEGDEVSLRLIHAQNRALAECTARVVRVQRADPMSSLLWKYVAAVEFERPLTEIEPALEDAESDLH
jgi:PilZ domain